MSNSTQDAGKEFLTLANNMEVVIAWLVEQRVSTLCEAGSNPVIALNFFTEVLCIISVMEEIPASLTHPKFRASVVLNYSCYVVLGLNRPRR